MERDAGHVWLVGAGPGDPRLLTLAAADALSAADVVVYDALVSRAVLRRCPAGAELAYAGKRAGAHAMRQEQINSLLVERALAGKRVVRLKGGDPFVFGRGAEEALACRQAGVAFTVIPGVTSALAAPAYAGIPVTHRGVAGSVLIITASDAGAEPSADRWEAAAHADTVVVLMGAAALEESMQRLMAAGKPGDTPAACVRWGTRPDQRVVRGTVATISGIAREAGLQAPIVTVAGAVAAFADELDWYRPGRLAGRTIVVTRARTRVSILAARLEALGAEVIEASVSRTVLHPENIVNDERVASRWDWIVFTSANGVEAFFEALRADGREARSLQTTQIAAIGEATWDALAAGGLTADFTPTRSDAATLAVELPRVSGARILLPASNLSPNDLATALRARGARVERVVAYETLPERLDSATLDDVVHADAITFTSGSAAQNLRAALGEVPPSAGTRLVSIGEQTSAAVRECFGRLDGEARVPSLDALVDATCEALA